MQIVIPSKGRANTVGERVARLFSAACVCVGGDEVDAYARVTRNLLVHRASIIDIGSLRQWVLDPVDDPY